MVENRRNIVSEVQVAYHPFLQPVKTAPAITGCNMPWLLNLSCGCCHDNVMFVWIIPAWVKLSGSWLAPGLMIPRPSSRSSQSVSLLWLGGPRSHSRYLNYLPWLGSSKTGGGVTLLRGRHIFLRCLLFTIVCLFPWYAERGSMGTRLLIRIPRTPAAPEFGCQQYTLHRWLRPGGADISEL